MKALVYYGPHDIRYQDVPTPRPKEGEVLVHVRAVSICGSDLAAYKAVSSMRSPGLIMGHEFSGEIVQLGEGVDNLKVGNRVGVITNIYCGKCPDCLEGRTNVCDHRYIIGTTMKAGSYNGAMSEFVVAPAEKIMLLPDYVSFDEAALVEPLSISLRATKHVAYEVPSRAIAVLGVGPIGLMAIMCMKNLGSAKIVAIDLLQNRLELARKCGATDTILSGQDVPALIRQMTDNVGIDVVFDAAGVPSTVNTAIEIVRNGGSILMVGMASPTLEIAYKHAVSKELKLQASYMYTTEMKEGLQMIADTKLNVAQMITSRHPLSEGPKVFEELASGNTKEVKVILFPE